MEYIATFYSHFGAIRYKKLCDKAGWSAKVMPVPRSLSSSCGTCVKWTGELPKEYGEEVEQVVGIVGDGYQVYYRAENG